ncbi:MAG: DNA translocase FtsK, partial [Boseongicola sp.]|nr:DNA translocase FtsK [Boseongicola sp.]
EIGRIGARIADVVERRTQGSGCTLREEPPLRRPESPGDLDFAGQEHPDIDEVDGLDEELSMPGSEFMDPFDTAPNSDRIAAPEARATVQHAAKRPARSRRARAEAEPFLPFSDRKAEFEVPPLGLLTDPITIRRHHLSDDALKENARMLESVLDDYGVRGEIVSVRPGPVVTMYELEPAPGLKASRVMGLADDIARSMSALSARVSTVPGRSVIGIELPNDNREMVVLREMLSTRDYGDSKQRLPLALGKNIGGDPVVADLARMPHLLIAGTTGSGKSVAINAMILSLLYKLTPEECRLIMIDPKMLELSVYDGIPHLLSPVVTDPKKAVIALKWIVGEMEDRYRKMSKMGVRNIDGYNGRVKAALSKGEMFSRTVQTGFDDETGDPVFETEEFEPETLPFVVVIVDEMADLMMVAGKEIEACIQRLAQMARASGIHLIMATQRPSVDVITGTIKANFPTRVSFQVTSKVDSRTILGEMGAEQLLGQGDMLYMAGGGKIIRVHGPFVSDEEVEEVVTHLKSFGAPEYLAGVVAGPDEDAGSDIDLVLGLGGNTDGEDALYDQAVQIVISDRKCSTSYIQRKLAIGYNKAARLVEQMEESGLVSAANHVGKREILVPEQG